MPAVCPACQSQLDPAADSCPICLRPRSREEMMRDFAETKKAQIRRRRLPLYIAAFLALAGAAYWKSPQAYRLAAPAIDRQVARAQAALDRAESPDSYAPDGSKPAGAPAARAALQPALSAAAQNTQQAAPPEPRPAMDPCDAVAAPEPPPEPETPEYHGPGTPPPAPHTPQAPALPAPTVWHVRGRTFELLSLKAVSDAQLYFTSPEGKTVRVLVDQSGRYTVDLPPLAEGGYSLSLKRAGKRADYLEEALAPFTEQDGARRRQEAEDALRSKFLHVPLVADERGCLAYDVALLPARRK